ncbi:MAG TPA: HAMP domain-containing sensor histidine kinase [Acidimicrobiia bacterium]|nr:HAMP domain-containing sensor histidine kinase [Acidimicrobiia bacterium]
MRRSLALLSLAVASLVVVAFLIPVGILIRNQAQTRALSGAERDAQSVAAAIAVLAPASPSGVVTPDYARAVLGRFGDPAELSVIFVDDTVVGAVGVPSSNVEQARRGAAFTAAAEGGAEVLVPVLLPDPPGTDGTVVVRAFVTDAELTRGVRVAWAMLLGLAVAIIAIAVLAADWLGRSVVRPVTELSEAAHRWGEGSLDTRVQPGGPQEIAEVGKAFNTLAGRLDELLAAERESVADLSHRLRTPLTALRLQSETLADPGESEALRHDVDELEREIDRLIRSARGRSIGSASDEDVDLGEVVAHRAAFWQVLADEQGRATAVRVGEGSHPVALARTDLGAMVDVLVENVFAHTPAGSGYRLTVRRQADGCPVLIVSDDGPGFVDLGAAKRGTSAAGSTGLGLDIVVRTAERTGGGVRIGSSRDGGAEVTVVFGSPLVPNRG